MKISLGHRGVLPYADWREKTDAILFLELSEDVFESGELSNSNANCAVMVKTGVLKKL